MQSLPNNWMVRQQQAGRRLCLILESHHEACLPMMAARSPSQYRNLYSETVAAELKDASPVILLVEHMNEPALVDLLQHPGPNWGWLGSLPDDDLAGVTRHWRERLLVGAEGARALYRFHDNRTLARALACLSTALWPVYLGPLLSVCYWHEDRWCEAENPAPGEYPAPVPAPWLNTPNPQAEAILHANILRYLLMEHSEDLVALAEFQDPKVWLARVLEQAHAWQWRGPEQLEFLVVRRLEESTRSSFIRWQPRVNETPVEHFERVEQQWRRGEGNYE